MQITLFLSEDIQVCVHVPIELDPLHFPIKLLNIFLISSDYLECLKSFGAL
jgi:hypothetical protein